MTLASLKLQPITIIHRLDIWLKVYNHERKVFHRIYHGYLMKTVHDIDPMLPPLTSPLGHQVCQHISTSLTVVHYKILTVTPSMNINQNIVCWQCLFSAAAPNTYTPHTAEAVMSFLSNCFLLLCKSCFHSSLLSSVLV